MSVLRHCLALCLVAALSLAPALHAQSGLATVTGLITDSADAVIPGVVVTTRNLNTNISHSMSSSGDGYFTVTSLSPGPYELTASKPGFNNFRESGIVLQVGQTLRRDIKMQVGSVSETVSVTAEAAPLNTENGAVMGNVIVQQEIMDVPLNGRDFADLALLVPGVLPTAEGGNGSSMAINGARSDNTNVYIDGVSNRNARTASPQFRPPIEALQEFKVEVGGFSAEYGRFAGGNLNMVLRTGGNQFHGSAFEYLRNGQFDARAYFDSSKLPLHRNQFGGVISGPVRLPKYNGRDRTFFMFASESYRERISTTRLGSVPTLLERSGDFSKSVTNLGRPITVTDPYNRNAPFPNNVIPINRFSPVALGLLNYYPTPNRNDLRNNYQSAPGTFSNWDNFLTKIDHRFSSNDSLSLFYGTRFSRGNNPFAASDLGKFHTRLDDTRSSGALAYTHMFSPVLISETRLGVSRNASGEYFQEAGFPDADGLGMPGSTRDPKLKGFPVINITGYLPLGYFVNLPVEYFLTEYQLEQKLTWIKGSHTVKAGVTVSKTLWNQPFPNGSRGQVTSTGSWTSYAVADFALGLLNSSVIQTDNTRTYPRFASYGFFIADDYKITRSLTLNLSLRYELNEPMRDKYDRLLNFVPELNKIVVSSDATIPNLNQLVEQANLQGRVVLANDYNLPRGLVYTNYKRFAPRLGLAWRPFGSQKTVLRGGYGIFHTGDQMNDVRASLATAFPFTQRLNYNRVTTDPDFLTLSTPWPGSRGTVNGTNTSSGFQLQGPAGYLQTYNLSLQRQLTRGTTLEIAYAGSKGTNLGRQYNINMPIRSMEYYQNFGTNFPVPYSGLGTINYWAFGSNSRYNSGQVTFQKRASGGLFYRLSYIYSKSIDDSSQLTGASAGGFSQALDSRNLKLERARSDWDRGHSLTAVLSWSVPTGRVNGYLRDRGKPGKLLAGVVGGWQLSVTSQIASGPPLTMVDSSTNLNIGESSRPNRIASGKATDRAGRSGVDYPWYDPSAFVHAAGCASRTDCGPDQYGFIPFQPGNSGRNILDGPGLVYVNMALLKNFYLGEYQGKRRFQLRYETFNILNHPNFLLPNKNFNELSAGTTTRVVDRAQGGPRVMQVALRFDF